MSEARDDEPGRTEPPGEQPKRRRWWQRGVGGTLGGAMVGIEQQVFRNQPPAHELVQRHRPDQPMSVDDTGLIITVPHEAGSDDLA